MRVYVQQIDETQLDGKVFDREALEELSKEGVTLVSHLDLFYYIFRIFYVDTVHIKGNSSGFTLGERYGFTSWAVKRQNNHKMSVAEMRVLRWISGNIRKDKIRNEDICLRIVVASSDEKMRENCLRWFGHV